MFFCLAQFLYGIKRNECSSFQTKLQIFQLDKKSEVLIQNKGNTVTILSELVAKQNWITSKHDDEVIHIWMKQNPRLELEATLS